MEITRGVPYSVAKTADGQVERNLHPAKLAELLKAGGQLWVDIDANDRAQHALLEKVFGLHPLAVEDTLSPKTRVKLEEYGSYIFIVVRSVRFDQKTDVRKKIEDVVKKLFASVPPFEGVHVFTPHADVPDDSALRLVVLPPEQAFLKEDSRSLSDAVLEYLKMHGSQPRHRANRLVFIAADSTVLNRLREATRVALAWASIVEDVDEGRLNIDQIQRKQAERESQAANRCPHTCRRAVAS